MGEAESNSERTRLQRQMESSRGRRRDKHIHRIQIGRDIKLEDRQLISNHESEGGTDKRENETKKTKDRTGDADDFLLATPGSNIIDA